MFIPKIARDKKKKKQFQRGCVLTEVVIPYWRLIRKTVKFLVLEESKIQKYTVDLTVFQDGT